MPKISVIIPVYNVEKYLRECLDSVINQTLKDIEIICVNDGSLDNSLEILREYAEKDSRIVIIDKTNEGAAIARNIGIKKAQGEYLAILDSDDIYKEKMLETLYNKAVSTESDIVICQAEEMDNQSGIINPLDNALRIDYLPQKEVFDYKDVISQVFNFCMGWSWDKLYKTDFIKETGLKFQNLRSTNDAYFVFMSIILAKRISCVKEILVTHRINTKLQLSESREKEPTCFIKAIKLIKEDLINRGLYEEVEQSFLNWAVGFCVWHIDSIKGLKNKNELAKAINKEIVRDLKILKKGENYFYKQSDYKKIVNIDTISGKFNRVMKNLFSIKNSNDKTSKVITLCGQKFKLRRRKYA